MKVRAYPVLCRAIEDGVAYGWRRVQYPALERAEAHSDGPFQLPKSVGRNLPGLRPDGRERSLKSNLKTRSNTEVPRSDDSTAGLERSLGFQWIDERRPWHPQRNG